MNGYSRQYAPVIALITLIHELMRCSSAGIHAVVRRYKMKMGNDYTDHFRPSIWHASRLAEITHYQVARV